MISSLLGSAYETMNAHDSAEGKTLDVETKLFESHRICQSMDIVQGKIFDHVV